MSPPSLFLLAGCGPLLPLFHLTAEETLFFMALEWILAVIGSSAVFLLNNMWFGGWKGKPKTWVWIIFFFSSVEGHCSEQSWVAAKESKSSCWGWAWIGQMQSWGGPSSAKALHPLPNTNIATLAPPENFNHFSCITSLCFWSKHFLRTNCDSR